MAWFKAKNEKNFDEGESIPITATVAVPITKWWNVPDPAPHEDYYRIIKWLSASGWVYSLWRYYRTQNTNGYPETYEWITDSEEIAKREANEVGLQNLKDLIEVRAKGWKSEIVYTTEKEPANEQC